MLTKKERVEKKPPPQFPFYDFRLNTKISIKLLIRVRDQKESIVSWYGWLRTSWASVRLVRVYKRGVGKIGIFLILSLFFLFFIFLIIEGYIYKVSIKREFLLLYLLILHLLILLSSYLSFYFFSYSFLYSFSSLYLIPYILIS